MNDLHLTWLQGPEERPDPVRTWSASPNEGRSSYLRPPALSWDTYETHWRATEPEYVAWQAQADTSRDGGHDREWA